MNSPLVSIVIVTYNSVDIIKRCLDLVLKATYPSKEIIIVDNNSYDGTDKIFDKYKGKVKVFFEKQNLGYSSGNNLGIKNSKGKYIFLLNPDTEVTKDFLQPLVEVMEKDEKVAVCQPLVYLLNDKEKINLTGKVTHFLGFDWIRDYLKNNAPSRGEITSFSGCGILLRKELIDKIGAFDQSYFMYYEDSDLSWRIRLFGYKIIFIPESIIFHDYKYIPQENYQSLKKKLYYNERNRLITVLKNYSGRTLLVILPGLVFIELAMIFYSLFNGWFQAKVKGYYSIIKLRGKINKSRQFVQRNRILSDKQIAYDFVNKLSFDMFNRFEVRVFINPVLSFYWKIAKNLI